MPYPKQGKLVGKEAVYGTSSNKKAMPAIRGQILQRRSSYYRGPQTDLEQSKNIHSVGSKKIARNIHLRVEGAVSTDRRAQSVSVDFKLISFFGFYEIFVRKE